MKIKKQKINETLLTNIRDMQGLTFAILNADKNNEKYIQVFNIRKEIIPYLTKQGYFVDYDDNSGIMTISWSNNPTPLTTGINIPSN